MELNVEKDEAGKVVSFDIDRRYWGKHVCLNPVTGMRCCLGFYGKAVGLTDEQLSKQDYLIQAKINAKLQIPETDWLRKPVTSSYEGINNEAWAYEYALSSINDGIHPNREEIIIQIFAEQGIKVRFIN